METAGAINRQVHRGIDSIPFFMIAFSFSVTSLILNFLGLAALPEKTVSDAGNSGLILCIICVCSIQPFRA